MEYNDAGFRPNSELRAEARVDLKGNWIQAILAYVVYAVIESTAAAIGGIGNLIIGGPIELGLVNYFLRLKRWKAAQIEDVFYGFGHFENSLVLYVVRTIFVMLWSLLFIIPGIVAALRYSMAMYILYDNSELSGMEAMRRSREMMEGNKVRLFGLYLSFVGWAVLCCFTLGLGFLWLLPYIKMTEAGFYEALKKAERV